MKKDDWYSLGISLGLHVLFFVLFGVITIAASQEQKPKPKYIEIEMGSIRMGQTVSAAGNGGGGRREKPVVKPEPPPRKAAITSRKSGSDSRVKNVRKTTDLPKKRVTPSTSSKQVNTPKQTPQKRDPEVVKTPKTDKVSPTEKPTTSESTKKRTDPEEQTTRTGGSTSGQTGSNTSSGRTGTGAGEGAGSGTGTNADAGSGRGRGLPFSIQGLNRDLISYGLPRYVDPINATVRVRITVDPRGRVTGVSIQQKGSPGLDRAVNTAVRNWRFSPLPENAPQQNQDGTVTFRFRLE